MHMFVPTLQKIIVMYCMLPPSQKSEMTWGSIYRVSQQLCQSKKISVDLLRTISCLSSSLDIQIPRGEYTIQYMFELKNNAMYCTYYSPLKVINVGRDTFGNPIFQKGLQN